MNEAVPHRLEQALRLLGADPAKADARTLADALWLARVLPEGDAATAGAGGAASPAGSRAGARPVAGAASGGEASPPPSPGTVKKADDTTALFVQQTGEGDEPQLHARRVPVPAADALPGRAAIERALRPFLRRRPSRVRRTVDAEATAEASAQASADALLAAAPGERAAPALVPVLRPMPERWFDLVLLAEQDDTMRVFEDTLKELRQLLARHGAFRRVGVWRWSVLDGAVHVRTASGMPSAPRAMLQGQHPQLIWVLTHGAARAWDEPPLRGFVHSVAAHSVVAVVQLLPETAWGATALGESSERVRSRERAATNRQLLRRDLWTGAWTREGASGVVPMLSLHAGSVARWAEFVMSPRALEHAAVALQAPADAGLDDEQAMDPPVAGGGVAGEGEARIREQVLRFRTIASPQAFALLRLLSGAWITLPVMRLLLQSMPGPSALAPMAEVLMSGLLRRTSRFDVRTEELTFDFAPGVREWLSGSLSGEERRALDKAMADSRDAIRQFVEARLKRTLTSFSALLVDPEGTEYLPASAKSFVEVSRKLRSLRGGASVAQPPVVVPEPPATQPDSTAPADAPQPYTVADPVWRSAEDGASPRPFVGRAIELEQMRRALLPNDDHLSPQPVFIIGPRGSGKTSLVREFVRRHRLPFWGIDMSHLRLGSNDRANTPEIDADTLGELVAKHMGIGGPSSALWQRLNAALRSPRHLLLFDEVDAPALAHVVAALAERLPECSIVATTGSEALGRMWVHIGLAPLSQHEAVTLLMADAASLGGRLLTQANAEELAHGVGYLPLGIRHAARRWNEGATPQQIREEVRGAPLKIFISHSSADIAAPRELRLKLRTDGHDPWLFEEDSAPVQNWQRETTRVLREADVVLACLSKRRLAAKPGFSQEETRLALEAAIHIIPVRLDLCEIPAELAQLHSVDYFAEDGYERLLRALEARRAQRHVPFPAEDTSGVAPDVSPPADVPPLAPRRPSIFLSYARENLKVVRKLVQNLEDLGFVCQWFDVFKPLDTDDTGALIEAAMQACDYFMPVLSNVADQRPQGRYWTEWAWAVELARQRGGSFLLPVGLDRRPPDRMGYKRIFTGATAGLGEATLLHAREGELDGGSMAELTRLLGRHGIQAPNPRPRIFISYAHEDLRQAEKLSGQLSGLLGQHGADLYFESDWSSTDNDWRRRLEDALARSNVYFLLLSPRYIATDFYLHHEARRALERMRTHGAKVYMVLLSDCEWERLRPDPHPDAPALADILAAGPFDEHGRLVPMTDVSHDDAAWIQIVQRLVDALNGQAR